MNIIKFSGHPGKIIEKDNERYSFFLGSKKRLTSIIFSLSKRGAAPAGFTDVYKYILLLVVFLCLPRLSYSQDTTGLKSDRNLSGAVTVTNNGISLIPTFSLGKPAVIFDGSFGKRLSFDPQLKFGLDGKPWGFIFWWRYKIFNTDKFHFDIGAHPAYVFTTTTDNSSGVPVEIIRAEKFVATEVSPNYFIAKNISLGIYYLYSHCFEPDQLKNTHFITVNANFTDIKISRNFYVMFNPQFYYLKMDATHGFYFTSSLTLAKKNFPLSVSSIINSAFQSDIRGSKDFVWNVSLIYSFNKKYVEQL